MREFPSVTAETTMSEYRKEYNEKDKQFMSLENRTKLRNIPFEIVDVLIKPRSVDMKGFRGSEEEMQRATEFLYANDGRRVYAPTNWQLTY